MAVSDSERKRCFHLLPPANALSWRGLLFLSRQFSKFILFLKIIVIKFLNIHVFSVRWHLYEQEMSKAGILTIDSSQLCTDVFLNWKLKWDCSSTNELIQPLSSIQRQLGIRLFTLFHIVSINNIIFPCSTSTECQLLLHQHWLKSQKLKINTVFLLKHIFRA